MTRVLVRGRWPLVGLLAIAAIGVIAALDYAITAGGLPEIDPGVSSAVVEERADARDAYTTRAWFYALGLVAAICATTFAAYRRAAEDRGEVFNDLGVAGVALGLVSWLVRAQEPVLLNDSSGGIIIFLPTIAMLGLAAVGRLATALGLGGPEEGRVPVSRAGITMAPRSMPAAALAALALGMLTVVLVYVAHSPRDCGEDSPAWSDTLLWLTLFTGIGAGACGLVALFQRRWIVGLITIPTPVLALLSLLVAACLN